MRHRLLLASTLAAATASLGIIEACGDDDSGATAGVDAGSSSGASSGTTSSGGSSGGSSSGSSGADAHPKNIGTWRIDPQVGLGTDWTGVYTAVPNDVHIVGNSPGTLGPGAFVIRGTLGSDGGLEWKRVFENSSYNFNGISGVAADDVWAVDTPSAGFDGGTWGPRAPGPGYANEIWGAKKNDWWAISQNLPTQLEHLGSDGGWGFVDAGMFSVFHVGGGTATPDNVYAIGYRKQTDGAAEIFVSVVVNGAVTSESSLGTGINPLAIWAVAANDVYVVGTEGLILHFDGLAWTKQTSGITTSLTAICGTASYDLFAVGPGGVLHFDGDTWSPETIPDAGFSGGVGLTDVWGSGPSDVWAVGYGGIVMHRTP